MKILLLTPPVKKHTHPHEEDTFHPVQGIAYVAAYLRQHFPKDKIRLIDARFQKLSERTVLEMIAGYQPGLIGISSMTHEILQAYELAKGIKRMLPHLRIILGGAHISTTGGLALEECQEIDIGVVGEGELTFLEVIKAIKNNKPLKGIKGVVFREQNGKVIQNEVRDLIADLDSIPFPAWDLYPKSRIYSLFSSRGCPCRCIFCPRLTGDYVRYHSADRVVDEMEYLIESFAPEEIHFNDDNFDMNKKRAHEILDRLIKRNLHQKVRWLCNSRANLGDYDTFVKMKAAGCYLISIGVESGSPQILKTIKKGITLEQAEKTVRLAKKAGLKVATNFLIGFPGETRATINQTIDFMCKLDADYFNLGCVVPFPKTELAQMAKEGEGDLVLIAKSWDDYDKVPGNSMELKDINRRALERYVMKGYLKFFLKNKRFKDLGIFILRFNKLILHMAMRLLYRYSAHKNEDSIVSANL